MPMPAGKQKAKEKADVEDDGVMRKEIRKKEKAFDFLKVVLKYAFSQIGVVVLCVGYAAVGANIYLRYEINTLFLKSSFSLFVKTTSINFIKLIQQFCTLSMELPLEEERRKAKEEVAIEIIKMEDFLSGAFWDLIHHQYPEKRLNETAFMDKVSGDLHQYVTKIVDASGENNYDGEVETWDYDWTFPNALLFTVTIMSTVGYGHISPKSDSGQLFTIIYSLIGIPLLMMFTGNIGNLFGDFVKYSYSRLCCR